ncbi:MAG: glycosyltransferase family 4 protein [Patescibacteria group bacterium]|nr:glycosyltransferase family 4 protein [Patescibacteria group bacterium]
MLQKMSFLNMRTKRKKIIIVSSFRPRDCGIATFSHDLANSLKLHTNDIEFEIIPINEKGGEDRTYNIPVNCKIEQQDINSYERAAFYINNSEAVAVSLQHEFGLHGGKCGEYVINFLERVKKPVLTTLHTVLLKPSKEEKNILRQIADLSSALIVMASTGSKILTKTYGIDKKKIMIIPHGVPDIELCDQKSAKKTFGLEDRLILSTFGLISSGKGIEYVIEALPRIKMEHDNVLYLILGKTHPGVIAYEGERYRDRLISKIKALDLLDNVKFINRFVDIEEYISYLKATDLYLTPYLNPQQVTSGTLVYAMSAGRICISTPYLHAKELHRDGHKMFLVPFRNSKSIAKTVTKLLSNDQLRKKMETENHKFSRSMTWERVSENYAGIIRSLAKEDLKINYQLAYSETQVLPTH